MELVSNCKIILHGNDEPKLKGWMEKAAGFQIKEIESFLKLIRLDMEAVINANIYHFDKN